MSVVASLMESVFELIKLGWYPNSDPRFSLAPYHYTQVDDN